ncbi:SRPBCC domain-containing protein [Thalassobaculum sp. OXR-137]|uniref:SRPBCC family protein n=1 Tax=Thalassobaculum sp. OXR-137 TaxID=3100173 RepID=UPI002AC91090|nr:SRPBCC domain-containing protein [Thalassobaculum sp. OXR-137]WPZ36524.1 SRPBCC domain-containing protein [Thalassobaculum sp. OXR-137]
MNLPFLTSPHGSDPVVVENTFKAPPARVFRAWTDPAEVKAWFGQAPHSMSAIEIDLREGGAWKFSMPPTETSRDALRGTYVTVEPDRKLVFTWCHEREFADGRVEVTPDSEVTVTFEPAEQGTFVRLTHSGIRKEDARKGVGSGWAASFGSIQALLEQEEAA